MPEISRFLDIVIAMYYNDHAPPHFHARYGNSEIRVNIRSGEIMSGQFPRRAQNLVLEWLELHRSELLEDWQLAENRKPLKKSNRWSSVMTPTLRTAEYAGEYRIKVSFDDGTEGILDLKDELWGEVFEPLKDVSQFRAFRVDPELKTIVWPTGADLAPEYLYERAAA